MLFEPLDEHEFHSKIQLTSPWSKQCI